MYGYLTLTYEKKEKKPNVIHTQLCGLPVLHTKVFISERMGEKRRERRVLRAGLLLYKYGVRRVFTSIDFPYWYILHQAGLNGVEVAPLCQAVAVPLTMETLKIRGWEPSRAVVALAGERVSTPLLHTAQKLAGQVYALLIEVPHGGVELTKYLAGEYGLPALLSGSVRPSLVVAFDDSWTGRGAALRLYGTRPDLLDMEVWLPSLQLPDECDTMPLLAALRESALLSDDDFLVRKSRKPP